MFRTDRWWQHELERKERAWEAERAQLIDTVCRLAGKPSRREQPEPRKDDMTRPDWTATPEQRPVH